MQFPPSWTSRDSRTSAAPLACFRMLFGLCLIFDILGLIEYAPMWFDPMPHVERAPGWVRPLLGLWLVVAAGLTLGVYTRLCAVLNYVACVTFMGFFSMPASCEFHPDTLYLMTSVALPFLPIGKVYSVDAWRKPPASRSIGPGAEIFFALLISNIYLDSAVWKLSSSMWANGLGYWTPASQPWPEMPSFAWTLENEWVAKAAGYVTLVFELLFVVLIWFRPLRWLLLPIGFVLHVGIGVVMPLPLFGLIMTALLVALVPIPRAKASPEELGPPSLARRVAPWFYGLWAIAFCIHLIDPVRTLAKVGLGGANGNHHKTWYSAAETPTQHAFASGLFWAYRLFGFRTHHIFIDDQFTRYTAQTRLMYVPPGSAGTAAEVFDLPLDGEAFFPPAYNRRFKAWHYRTAYAYFPLARVEARLQRWLAFHHGRGDIDAEQGWVSIEQRPISMPVDGWRPGQRARNVATPWRRVGVAQGSPGSLDFTWRDPCWAAAP